jgi:hypothetical protein
MMDIPSVTDDDLARKGERVAFLNREAAEVYLLLDFLSGRADRSLRPTQEELARTLLDRQVRPTAEGAAEDEQRAEIEDDLSDPTRLVLRTMRIKYPLEQADRTFQADATFLVRARDVLNTRAWPATGATIAFTTLVFAYSPTGKQEIETTAEFAERAYPQFKRPAQALARSIASTLLALVAVLLLSLTVSAYTAWGKFMVDTLDAVRRDDGATRQALSVAGAVPASGDPTALCAAKGTDRLSACTRVDDLKDRYAVTLHQISTWEQPLRLVSATIEQERDEPLVQKQTEQWASAALAVLGNYIMPILYGLLGSIAFVLRRYYDRLAGQLLSPRDQRANTIRVALGVLIGGCIGLVYSGSAAAQTTGILGAAITLSTASIAFLAGYGVEGVFKMLDALINQVFRVNGGDKPPQLAG